MSVIEYPDSINPPDLQIWNNAAFDNGGSEESASAVKSSWSLLQFGNLSESIESDMSKENLSPNPVNPSVPLKPLCQIGNSQAKPLKALPRSALIESVSASKELGIRDERKIDSEIEEIENEIWRLSSKLEALRIEKIDRIGKGTVEKKGRVVPAKFMEQKSSVKNLDPPSAQSRLSRRGFSLGPAEIAARARQLGKPEITLVPAKFMEQKSSVKNLDPPSAQSRLSRRGFSLGPAEIAARARQLSKPEITPVQPIQNRRKSYLWKLQEIDERNITKERGQSLSLSPKSPRSKIQPPKQLAATTVGPRKVSKKEDSLIMSIQPKKLFGDKPGTAKKPGRTGRVVPSRYSQIQSNGSSIATERKRSLSEDGNEEAVRSDKRRVSMVGKSWGSEARAKKKWEVPSEIVVYNAVEETVRVTVSSPLVGVLPRIRTSRCGNGNDSPRDSGAAKRVAELVGRRSVFSAEEEEELPVCQALSFGDDAEEE